PSEYASPANRRKELYSPEWTERTYEECLCQAESLLFEGKRVLVDATFREEHHRQAFLQTALRWGVPGVLLLTRAEPETIRQRLASRKGAASDADWDIYVQVAEGWEEPGPKTLPFLREIDCGSSPESAQRRALEVLKQFGL